MSIKHTFILRYAPCAVQVTFAEEDNPAYNYNSESDIDLPKKVTGSTNNEALDESNDLSDSHSSYHGSDSGNATGSSDNSDDNSDAATDSGDANDSGLDEYKGANVSWTWLPCWDEKPNWHKAQAEQALRTGQLQEARWNVHIWDTQVAEDEEPRMDPHRWTWYLTDFALNNKDGVFCDHQSQCQGFKCSRNLAAHQKAVHEGMRAVINGSMRKHIMQEIEMFCAIRLMNMEPINTSGTTAMVNETVVLNYFTAALIPGLDKLLEKDNQVLGECIRLHFEHVSAFEDGLLEPGGILLSDVDTWDKRLLQFIYLAATSQLSQWCEAEIKLPHGENLIKLCISQGSGGQQGSMWLMHRYHAAWQDLEIFWNNLAFFVLTIIPWKAKAAEPSFEQQVTAVVLVLEAIVEKKSSCGLRGAQLALEKLRQEAEDSNRLQIYEEIVRRKGQLETTSNSGTLPSDQDDALSDLTSLDDSGEDKDQPKGSQKKKKKMMKTPMNLVPKMLTLSEESGKDKSLPEAPKDNGAGKAEGQQQKRLKGEEDAGVPSMKLITDLGADKKAALHKELAEQITANRVAQDLMRHQMESLGMDGGQLPEESEPKKAKAKHGGNVAKLDEDAAGPVLKGDENGQSTKMKKPRNRAKGKGKGKTQSEIEGQEDSDDEANMRQKRSLAKQEVNNFLNNRGVLSAASKTWLYSLQEFLPNLCTINQRMTLHIMESPAPYYNSSCHWHKWNARGENADSVKGRYDDYEVNGSTSEPRAMNTWEYIREVKASDGKLKLLKPCAGFLSCSCSKLMAVTAFVLFKTITMDGLSAAGEMVSESMRGMVFDLRQHQAMVDLFYHASMMEFEDIFTHLETGEVKGLEYKISRVQHQIDFLEEEKQVFQGDLDQELAAAESKEAE
ncbi:hypothetical protein C8J56DRAFT_892890 [Mycena floridula]|nr:hypothetical protein C8J56DRAFT_892890 [Mycena floridula]